MVAHHSFFELRTSRDAEHSPEAAMQLFSTLPLLRNKWWHAMLRKTERISFEISVINQTITFSCVIPTRLIEYFKSVLTASYPEIIITELNRDPAAALYTNSNESAPRSISVGAITLKNKDYLPLKTFAEFKELDSLSALLSTLSSSDPQDTILIQVVISDDGESWKHRGWNRAKSETGQAPHPQQAMIEQKLAKKAVNASVRMAVASATPERSKLILESIAATFQTVTYTQCNSLVLKRPWVLQKQWLQALFDRAFGPVPRQHLSVDEVATLYHLPNKAVAAIPNIAWGKNLPGEPPENLPIITKDMDPEQKKDINAFAQTIFKNAPQIYGLKRADRRRHTYVIGKTGTGKSTLLANMAINDLKNNEGLCVIDPHGDLVETILNYIPSHRINDVVYFDPADPERTVKINLFEGENVVHRELIASGIVSIFQKLYEYSWGPRLEYILRNALLTLLKAPQARLSDILDMLTDEVFRAKLVDSLDDPILKNFWVNEFNQMQDKLRSESIAPILNKVGQFVSSPLIRDVVNSHKSSFSIEELMDDGKILLVNLSQGRLGEDNATLLGALLITKIQLAAMGRVNRPEAERRDFYLYVDEFQNFATQSFNKILSEARKYRLNLVLANQYIAQIPEDVQKAIFGNCGSMVSFVMGADDASVFTKEYSNIYSADDLVSLSRYQIINKLSIDNVVSRPFPAYTLPLAKSSNGNRDKVVKVSSERYAKKK